MSGRLKQYNPKEVIITWGDQDITTGIASGTFVTIARNERSSTMNVGGDGGATRVINPNRSATIAITYRKGGASLGFLADKVSDEELEPPVYFVQPLQVKDFSGNTLHFSEQAFIDGPPDDEFGTDESNVTVTFVGHDTKMEVRPSSSV